MSAASDPLLAAREALKRWAWREAYDHLIAADASGRLSAEELEGLAQAAWWTGRLSDCIAARERAHAAHLEAGNHRRAGAVALELARNYYGKQNSSVATAWFKRAERLLDQEPDSVEHGHLARMRCVLAFEGERDFEAALGHAEQTLAIGTRLGDRDLMALGLQDRGRILIATGQVAEGLALMDEATVAAVSGELGPLTTGIIYCNIISACEGIADYRRAGEWNEAAKRWCDRQAIAGFPGLCRVHRAAIMRVRGAWAEAEREAVRACEELRDFNLNYAAAAFYELGEVRLRLGNLRDAAEAFRQAHELGRDPQPGLSLLRFAEGRTDAALKSITAALADDSLDRLTRARLLPAQVEIARAAGETETARMAVEELEALAKGYGTPALEASALCARGMLQLAQGDHAGARRSLRRGYRLWHEVEAPYEAARARVALAAACRAEGDGDAATLELEAARSVLERLGAELDARRVGQLLSELSQEGGRSGAPAAPVARTLMFTDIVKSTQLVEAVGDEAWTDLVQWHDRTLRSLFAGHGGDEIDHAGDGFFVVFESSARAIDCAIAIQRTLSDHRRAHGFSPQVRIGVHRGTASRIGASYRGKGVHVAARIAHHGQGGEILASRETVVAEPGRFAASDPQVVQLAGISEPVEIVRIVWRQPA